MYKVVQFDCRSYSWGSTPRYPYYVDYITESANLVYLYNLILEYTFMLLSKSK